MTIDRLRTLIDQALPAQSALYAGQDAHARDARAFVCKAAGCERRGYASGYCNAHYLRSRRGEDMAAPIRNRKRSADCIDCGSSTGGKGGWHRCATCYKSARRKVIKAACVAYLGDLCSSCGQTFPLPVYDFHHVAEKRADISVLISGATTSRIAEEMMLCELLCANCHRMEHAE